MSTTEVFVSEYIQVAHRLINLPGKCQNIHGHSMHVTMYISGEVNEHGLVINKDGSIQDFSKIKETFRRYLSTSYDHHLLLNDEDPWAKPIVNEEVQWVYLPGLISRHGDPTTENIGNWILSDMSVYFQVSRIEIQETTTNGVIVCTAP